MQKQVILLGSCFQNHLFILQNHEAVNPFSIDSFSASLKNMKALYWSFLLTILSNKQLYAVSGVACRLGGGTFGAMP